MHERESPRMEQKRPSIMPIPCITHNGVPGLREVDANLVLAPALQLHFHERGCPVLRQHSVKRTRELAFRRLLHGMHHERLGVLRQIALEHALLLLKVSMNAGQIGLFGELVPVRAEMLLHFGRLGDHHHARSLAVEAVNEIDALPALGLPFSHIIGERAFHAVSLAVTPRGARQDPRRLLDHDDVRIFVENRNSPQASPSLSHGCVL